MELTLERHNLRVIFLTLALFLPLVAAVSGNDVEAGNDLLASKQLEVKQALSVIENESPASKAETKAGIVPILLDETNLSTIKRDAGETQPSSELGPSAKRASAYPVFESVIKSVVVDEKSNDAGGSSYEDRFVELHKSSGHDDTMKLAGGQEGNAKLDDILKGIYLVKTDMDGKSALEFLNQPVVAEKLKSFISYNSDEASNGPIEKLQLGPESLIDLQDSLKQGKLLIDALESTVLTKPAGGKEKPDLIDKLGLGFGSSRRSFRGPMKVTSRSAKLADDACPNSSPKSIALRSLLEIIDLLARIGLDDETNKDGSLDEFFNRLRSTAIDYKLQSKV